MRGCYFTSGTQEGRPIDRIMNSMAEAFGIQPRMQMMAPVLHSSPLSRAGRAPVTARSVAA